MAFASCHRCSLVPLGLSTLFWGLVRQFSHSLRLAPSCFHEWAKDRRRCQPCCSWGQWSPQATGFDGWMEVLPSPRQTWNHRATEQIRGHQGEAQEPAALHSRGLAQRADPAGIGASGPPTLQAWCCASGGHSLISWPHNKAEAVAAGGGLPAGGVGAGHTTKGSRIGNKPPPV